MNWVPRFVLAIALPVVSSGVDVDKRDLGCAVSQVDIETLPTEGLTARSFATVLECLPGVTAGSSSTSTNFFVETNVPITNAPVQGQPDFSDAVVLVRVGSPFDLNNLPPLDAARTWIAPTALELRDGWGQWGRYETIAGGTRRLAWDLDLPVSDTGEKTYLLFQNIRVNPTNQNGPRANVAPARFVTGAFGSTTDGVIFESNTFALGRTRQGIFSSTSTAVDLNAGTAAGITRVFEGIERDELIRVSQDQFGNSWAPRIGFSYALPQGVDGQFRFQNHYDTGSPGVLGDGLALTRVAGASPDGTGGAIVDPFQGGDFTTSDPYVFYEMTDSNPGGLESIDLNWSATFSGNLSVENWGNIRYSASLAPLSTVGESSANVAYPRFYDFGMQNPGGVCTSFSLFPYVNAGTGTADGVAAPLCDPFLFPGAIFPSASFLPGRSSNGPISRSSFFTGYGSGFPSISTGLSWPLQDNLDGLEVEIRPAGGGAVVPAIPIASNGFQFNAIATRDLPLGDIEIRVHDTLADAYSNWVESDGAEVAHGILTTTANGRGPAIAQKVVGNLRSEVNPYNFLVPGDIAVVWGSGDGSGDNDDHVPPAVVDNRGSSVIYLGNTPATETFYIGKSGCCSALTEYIFRVPVLGEYGFNTPVQICESPDGQCSNVATLPVFADNSTPNDPFDPFNTSVHSLQAPGNFGRIEFNFTTFSDALGQELSVGSGTEGRFLGYNPLTDYSPANNPPPPGTCVSFAGSGNPGDTLSPAPGNPLTFFGGRITQLGGSNAQHDLQLGAPGLASWSALGPADPLDVILDWYYNQGPERYRFDFNLPGQPGDPVPEVGQFSFEMGPFISTVSVSPPGDITLGQDITVNWEGGDDSREFVRIGLLGQDPVTGEFGAVDCTARASDGSFTIPRRHTQGFPINQFLNPTGIDGLLTLTTSTFSESVSPTPVGTDGVAGIRTTSFGSRVRLNYDF